MKTSRWAICLALAALLLGVCPLQGAQSEAYFGLEPPSERPELFAPGIVSLAGGQFRESDIGFWPDGLRCLFARFGDGIPDYTIFECRWKDDGWTEPAPSPLFPDGAFEPSLSPIGRRIFYVPPDPPARHGGHVLHMMEFVSGGWSAPEPLFRGLYASADLEGTLYYTTFYRNWDHIAYRTLKDGEYSEQRLVGSNVYDSRHEDAHPCIAPDGSYLIFGLGHAPAQRGVLSVREFPHRGRRLDEAGQHEAGAGRSPRGARSDQPGRAVPVLSGRW